VYIVSPEQPTNVSFLSDICEGGGWLVAIYICVTGNFHGATNIPIFKVD
jgi:hypothetical protein